MFTFVSSTHLFEMAHFWIDMLTADDVVVKLVSKFKFDFNWIGKKLTIRVMMVSR